MSMRSKPLTLVLVSGLAAAPLASGCSAGAGADAAPIPIEEAGSCAPTVGVSCPDPVHPPSYETEVAPLVRARCSPCHFPGGIMSAMYDLSTYGHLVDAQTAIVSQLYSCAMPPTRGDAKYGITPGTVQGITVAQATTLIEWIGCNTPNN